MNSSESSTEQQKSEWRLVDAFDHRVDFEDMMRWNKKHLLEILSQTGRYNDTDEQREISKAYFAKLLNEFHEAHPNFTDPYPPDRPRKRRR